MALLETENNNNSWATESQFPYAYHEIAGSYPLEVPIIGLEPSLTCELGIKTVWTRCGRYRKAKGKAGCPNHMSLRNYSILVESNIILFQGWKGMLGRVMGAIETVEGMCQVVISIMIYLGWMQIEHTWN